FPRKVGNKGRQFSSFPRPCRLRLGVGLPARPQVASWCCAIPRSRMAAVQIRDVTKTFGKHTAVDNLSLDVPEGTVYGFIGPNGSGKTTTLRMIMRILHPDRGTIQVLGEHSLGAASDRVGYLPEERGLYKQMTVRD